MGEEHSQGTRTPRKRKYLPDIAVGIIPVLLEGSEDCISVKSSRSTEQGEKLAFRVFDISMHGYSYSLVERSNHGDDITLTGISRGKGLDDGICPVDVRLRSLPLRIRDPMSRVIKSTVESQHQL